MYLSNDFTMLCETDMNMGKKGKREEKKISKKRGWAALNVK